MGVHVSDDVEFPEPGEIVLATVVKIIDQGAYVTLDEYDGLQGFLHTQEIAPGWIKAINRYVKRGRRRCSGSRRSTRPGGTSTCR